MNYFQKDVNVCWTCSEDNSTANSFSVFIEGQPVLFVVVLDYRVQWPDMWNVIFPILLIHLKWLCLLVLNRLEMRCGFVFLFTQPVLILSIFIPLFLWIINTMINGSILTHYLVLHTICVIGTLGATTESNMLAWSSSFWHQTWKRRNTVFFFLCIDRFVLFAVLFLCHHSLYLDPLQKSSIREQRNRHEHWRVLHKLCPSFELLAWLTR